MKRFFTMIVAACAFFAVSAQFPMATLSHNGELSFFTNVTALNSAYNSAVNGDTIYLSKGDFVVEKGAITISKRLSIVGNGYDSHILGNVTINMADNPNSAMEAPLFDGVRLDYLTFSSVNSSDKNLGESEVRRSWIKTLDNGAYAGKNITYDKCIIEKAQFYGNGTVVVKNSKIKGTGSTTNDNMNKITAINCNILNPYYYPLSMVSCILKKGSNPTVGSTTISIINSLLDFNPTSSGVNTFDCYISNDATQEILDENMDCTLNLEELGYLGEDGTVVGIMGGEFPFSENPSIPSVDTANSSVEYDAENNKLKVSITVKAD